MNRTRRDWLRAMGAAGALGSVGRVGARLDEGDESEEPPSAATETPTVDEIPDGGAGRNFTLVGHAPLLDDHQYVGDESLGIPRGSNGDITVAGDCVYVGSFVGYQPPLIVDIEDPSDPEIVGPVPDAIPGVGNGIEGIEASGDVLVIDHRDPLSGLEFDTPAAEPERGLSVYDISEPREPELVTRYDYDGRGVHAVSLWRDPEDPDRLLAVQSFTDLPNVVILDLTGCPDDTDCDPRVVAEWSLETQVGIEEDTHEAMHSTDGERVYVSQYDAGVFLLDSSNLLADLRNDEDEYDPEPPDSTPGDDHRLTLLNPDEEGRLETDPPFGGEWHHTPLKVPGRPYLFSIAESSGPRWDDDDEEIVTANCPGAFSRLVYVGDEEYAYRPSGSGEPMEGDRTPGVVGVFALPEQRLEHCGPDGWEPDEDGDVALPAWFSPHYATVFPNVAFVTYYGAGLRAVDISNPFSPREAGYFFNDPADEVRWASYGIYGETVSRGDAESAARGDDLEHTEIDLTEIDLEDDLAAPDIGVASDDERSAYDEGAVDPDDLALYRPAPGPSHMFAFSFPIVHDGYVLYADVHSGLYVLEYDGPHADEIPTDETCISGNPGAAEPGFEPCPPYGETDWEDDE